jgi:nicotinamidase-related amidase
MNNTKFNKNFKNSKNVKSSKKEVEDNITLIIVDWQDDFGIPGGALYVQGAENTKQPIIDYVLNNKKRINQIIFTRDWHTKKDYSFKRNGGEWPDHCVQGTDGAQINPELFKALRDTRIPIFIVDKGTVYDHEEYGAFEHCGTFHHLHPNDKPNLKWCHFANFESSSGVRIFNENLVVCGIAGDYCVKETIKNLLGHWRQFKISVLMDGVASIDGGTAINELIVEKNLKKI